MLELVSHWFPKRVISYNVVRDDTPDWWRSLEIVVGVQNCRRGGNLLIQCKQNFAVLCKTYKLTYRIMTCTLEQILPTLWYSSYYEYQISQYLLTRGITGCVKGGKGQADQLCTYSPAIVTLATWIARFSKFLEIDQGRVKVTSHSVTMYIYIF
jgi:hypothetical protein